MDRRPLLLFSRWKFNLTNKTVELSNKLSIVHANTEIIDMVHLFEVLGQILSEA